MVHSLVDEMTTERPLVESGPRIPQGGAATVNVDPIRRLRTRIPHRPRASILTSEHVRTVPNAGYPASSLKWCLPWSWARSDTECSGQLVDAVACEVNELVGRQALAVISKLVGAVDEGGLHPYLGHGVEFPRMGSNHHHP